MNHESEQTRRQNRENRRNAMLIVLLVLLAVGIHCCHHRQLYFGNPEAEVIR